VAYGVWYGGGPGEGVEPGAMCVAPSGPNAAFPGEPCPVVAY